VNTGREAVNPVMVIPGAVISAAWAKRLLIVTFLLLGVPEGSVTVTIRSSEDGLVSSVNSEILIDILHPL
jgi:hypothetical protein